MDAVLRVAFVFVWVLAAFRLLGKRELGKLSPFELVVLLLIPEIFSDALVGEDYSMTGAVIGAGTLLTLVFLVSLLSHRFPGVEGVVEGDPTVLVRDGAFCERSMNRVHVSPDEVFAQMRMAGVERLEEVRWAILEADGKISIVPTSGRSARPAGEDEEAEGG
jgi:uncharacterized membrane protein YcaP (DUF421 family)